MRRAFRWFVWTLLPLAGFAAPVNKNAAGIEFFESKIRPLFAGHCYKCHSHQSEKVRGGFMLDTREGLRAGGDSGPAIVPGHPESSLLIKAVSYTDKDLQMPPKDQKLADDEIQDLRIWVKMGAPDPRTNNAATATVRDFSAARQHWAFQPVVEPPVPKVHRHKSWIKTPLDAFVLENLNAKGLKPSPPADKRTLIRRATFDLIGLPPTEQEVNDFLADKSADAFAKVVDRLLASPQYGERWGRYWLDVARYADTKGPYAFRESSRLPYAYTYRDYVIRSFNEDLPYDEFIREQLAADQLPSKQWDNRKLAAMGFLTVGRRFFGNENEIIDDRIDVVSRGLLGLTVACARCHDHKFDPIPTRDYYSWHGIFRSSIEPTNLPLLTLPLPAQYTNYLEDVRTNEEALNAYVTSNETAVLTKLRSATGEYLLAVHDTAAITNNSVKIDELLRSRKLNRAVYLGWKTNLATLEKTNADLFAPWFAFARLPATEWTNGSKLADSFATNKDLNPRVAKLFAENPPTNLNMVASNYDALFTDVATNIASDDAGEQLWQFMEAPRSPLNPPREEFARVFLFDNVIIAKIAQLKRKLVDIEATDPGAPARAMVLEDKPAPGNSRIFLRGDPAKPGAVAPRGFLQVLYSPNEPVVPKKASGRLQLAEDIASSFNPLTARVFVNRVWMHHFGAPLVETPSDFGVRTPKPLQAGLLDYMAVRFMADGWSIKKLHRLIMLSSVYQESSAENDSAERVDPDNNYLWRMNPQRLDFEAMRDSFLAVAGELETNIGGQPVDISSNLAPSRRTVYGMVDRGNLPEFFYAFDFANPDTSSAGRFETTVAPQALFLLNSPLLVQCAHGLAARSEDGASTNGESRIRKLYEIAYQREPTKRELGLALDYLTNQPAHDAIDPEPGAWQYGWGTFNAETGRTESFNLFPVFTNGVWRPGKADKKAGYSLLNSAGGVPGSMGSDVIRRWIAPRDGVVSIKGDLIHSITNGNGVRARIISSRAGLLGEWEAHHSRTNAGLTNIIVKKNDAIDFMVEYAGKRHAGGFQWAPVIEMARANAEQMGLPHVWSAKENFIDPKKVRQPMGAWDKLAQVLLMSNEFFFVE